jgi:hypothetical protein
MKPGPKVETLMGAGGLSATSIFSTSRHRFCRRHSFLSISRHQFLACSLSTNIAIMSIPRARLLALMKVSQSLNIAPLLQAY